MREATIRYRSILADSARWEGFPFREGDIVISTPSKCGTTWTQMICALLVFQTPDFDRPLAEISPWFDMQTTARQRGVFHRGTSGQWHSRLNEDDLRRYHRRVAQLGDPEVAGWVHRDTHRDP